mgnify:CR=1 FL=1
MSISSSEISSLLDKAVTGDRLTPEEGLTLLQSHDLAALGAAANAVRPIHHTSAATTKITANGIWETSAANAPMASSVARVAAMPSGWELGERTLGPPLGAIVDLERNANAELRKGRAMDAFRATFDEYGRREPGHGNGVEAPVARNQHRPREAGLHEPPRRRLMRRGEDRHRAKSSEAAGQGLKRHRKGRHRAAIDAHLIGCQSDAAKL